MSLCSNIENEDKATLSSCIQGTGAQTEIRSGPSSKMFTAGKTDEEVNASMA